MRRLDDATLDRVYVDLVRPLLFEDLSVSAAPEHRCPHLDHHLLKIAGSGSKPCNSRSQAAAWIASCILSAPRPTTLTVLMFVANFSDQ